MFKISPSGIFSSDMPHSFDNYEVNTSFVLIVFENFLYERCIYTNLRSSHLSKFSSLIITVMFPKYSICTYVHMYIFVCVVYMCTYICNMCTYIYIHISILLCFLDFKMLPQILAFFKCSTHSSF